jgi:phosphoribosylanthranilate isomerase
VPPLVSAVGLFVNATPEWIREVTSNVSSLSLLQFHGDETPRNAPRSLKLPVCPGGAPFG